MVNFARERGAKKLLVATETGIIHRLQKELPDTEFHAVSERAICRFMKMTTLESVRDALRLNQHVITVPPDVAERASLAIRRMVEIV
jgi:quinolinate synthase